MEKTVHKITNIIRNHKVVLVTKNRAVEKIREIMRLTGIKRVAENRLEEAEKKFAALPPDIEKHFIGKLQSRKIKKICVLFDVIQSLENISQAEKINAVGKKIKVMIEVNISGLPQRSGVMPKKFGQLLSALEKFSNIKVIGVMGMAGINRKKTRAEFKLLKKLQGNLTECSMGMSDDYQIALEEGSTMLRLGRILFEDALPQTHKYE